MSKQLFNEFPQITSKEWKQKIQYDLKGADYNETLIWKTSEGINVKPFYHSDETVKTFNSFSRKHQWAICQTIFVHDVSLSNKKAVDVLTRGAESIKFILPSNQISISELLNNINLKMTSLYFELQFLDSEYIQNLVKHTTNAQVTVNADIISNLAKTGNWFSTLEADHKLFETIVKSTNTISIDMALYQNAGATMVQQLAYALAHANEYLNHFNERLTSEAKKTLNVTFNVAVGTNYFFEIAKLRALRSLWETIASEYNTYPECHIFVTPTKRNKTLYDYNTNMLRTTTECMSAILGGADTICNLAYDAIYHKDNEFGERIARNQLLILKHESYFDKVLNPSDGAYYIESLTEQLAEKALTLFKDIENQGGFLKQLKDGIVQRKIKDSAAKEQAQFNEGAISLLGTNKHPNPADKMKYELELYPFIKTNTRKTLLEPILEKRLAETLEQNRLQTE